MWDARVDFLVVGSGAAGMTAALRAHDLGARTLVVEKASLFGGSTALSGGVVWVPNNPLMAGAGVHDCRADALEYLSAVTAGSSTPERLAAYADNAPRMMRVLARDSQVRFECVPDYPDYYPEAPGGKPGARSCEPAVFDALQLGPEFARMRFHPPERMVMGGRIMVQVSEGALLLEGGRQAVWFMLRRLAAYYANRRARRLGRRITDVTLGCALVGRLRLSLLERGVPLWLETPLRELVVGGGRVIGAVVEKHGVRLRLRVARAVLLASGGFERDAEMRRRYQRQPIGVRWTAGCDTNTGDAVAIGVATGGVLDLMDDAWWCPVTLAPAPADDPVWIMIFEKNLPGSIIVDRKGQRFMNEAAPYNDVVKSMYSAHTDEVPAIPAFFVFDAAYRRKYPVGPMLPAYVVPDRRLPPALEGRFFWKAKTLQGLAEKIGVDAAGLLRTVVRFNRFATAGKDDDFRRGQSLQDRYYSVGATGPNPNLGPLETPPFYAVQVFPGDLGTKGGLRTDAHARVVREGGDAIPGLYAAGNCSASVMGRTYPGAGGTIGPAMTFGFLAAEDAMGFASV